MQLGHFSTMVWCTKIQYVGFNTQSHSSAYIQAREQQPSLPQQGFQLSTTSHHKSPAYPNLPNGLRHLPNAATPAPTATSHYVALAAPTVCSAAVMSCGTTRGKSTSRTQHGQAMHPTKNGIGDTANAHGYAATSSSR